MRKAFLFLVLILLLPAVFSSTFNRTLELKPNWQQVSDLPIDCYENNDKIQLINSGIVLMTIECKTYSEKRDIMPFEVSVAGGYPNETLNFSEQKYNKKTLFDSKINVDLFFDECNVGDCVHVNELKIELPAVLVPKLKAFVVNENQKSLQEKMESRRPAPVGSVIKTFYISESNPNDQEFAEEIACPERKCAIEFAGKENEKHEKIIVLDLGEVYDKAGGLGGWASWGGPGGIPGVWQIAGSADFDTKVLGKLDETLNFKEDTADNWRTHSDSGIQIMLYLDHFSFQEGTYVHEAKIRLGEEYVNTLKEYYGSVSPITPSGQMTGVVVIEFTSFPTGKSKGDVTATVTGVASPTTKWFGNKMIIYGLEPGKEYDIKLALAGKELPYKKKANEFDKGLLDGLR